MQTQGMWGPLQQPGVWEENTRPTHSTGCCAHEQSDMLLLLQVLQILAS